MDPLKNAAFATIAILFQALSGIDRSRVILHLSKLDAELTEYERRVAA